MITLSQAAPITVQSPDSLRSRIASRSLNRTNAIELWAVIEPHAFVLAELVARHVASWNPRKRLVSLGCDGLKEYLLTRHLQDVSVDVVDSDAEFVAGLASTFNDERLTWGKFDLLHDDYSRFAGAHGALLLQMDYTFSDAEMRLIAGSLAAVEVERVLVLTPSILRLSPRPWLTYLNSALASPSRCSQVTYRRTVSKLASLFNTHYRNTRRHYYPLLSRPTWVLEFERQQ